MTLKIAMDSTPNGTGDRMIYLTLKFKEGDCPSPYILISDST